ncbi:MAG TPA: citryl-CoA lyase [Candidatus Nanoarchaeia archaeon]|nr:citryl-CoA lyase [Candidatus Nanoarchaeia archaeon]
MQYQTRISKLENDDVIVRGEKLSDLVKAGKFSDAVFLEISGRKPKLQESQLFERMLISVMDHGMGVVSSLTSRFVVSGGNSLNVGVGAGVLSIGNYHGGAIEPAMKMFYELAKLGEEAKEKVKEMINNKVTIYGFGHKHYKDSDPRVLLLLEEVKKIGFSSKHLYLKKIIEESFIEIKGKQIPCNIDGILALFLCDFGFDYLLGKGVFIIGRTPGLVAQVHEELKYEKPVRRVSEEEIEFIQE